MARTLDYLFTMLWGAVPALAVYLCLRPWRNRRLAGRNLFSPRLRELVLALLWIFCGGMAAVTLTPRWVVPSMADVAHGYGWNAGGYPFFALGTVSLMPFRTFSPSPYTIYNLIGNTVMFTPFGLFAGLLFRNFGWKRALFTGFCITAFIECWQLCVGRAFDIDDLMLNTLGVFCGFFGALAVRRRFPRFAAKLLVCPQLPVN